MIVPCEHIHVVARVCDQTLGVACTDCKTLLAWCWAEKHVPESLWNRVAKTDFDANACDQDRDDFCAICGLPILEKLKSHE
jgi:hypothetical protein